MEGGLRIKKTKPHPDRDGPRLLEPRRLPRRRARSRTVLAERRASGDSSRPGDCTLPIAVRAGCSLCGAGECRAAQSEAIARSLAALHGGEASVAIAFADADPDPTAGAVTIRDGRLSGVARYRRGRGERDPLHRRRLSGPGAGDRRGIRSRHRDRGDARARRRRALAEITFANAAGHLRPIDQAATIDELRSPSRACCMRRARTAPRGARSRWRSTTPRSASSSGSRSAASRRSSTSSRTT